MTPIETLRAEATALGIKFHPSLGETKLQSRIDAAKATTLVEPKLVSAELDVPPNDTSWINNTRESMAQPIIQAQPVQPHWVPPPVEVAPTPIIKDDAPVLTVDEADASMKPAPAPVQTAAERFSERKKKASELVRVKVVCMDTNKSALSGELVSVGSAKMGTFKRMIQFGVPWHMPRIMYKAMKDKQCTIFKPEKDKYGKTYKKASMMNAYSIELLDPLTGPEIHELAQQQAMAGNID